MKEFIVKATIKTDKTTGKKKIIGLHFLTESIRQIIDWGFIKTKHNG